MKKFLTLLLTVALTATLAITGTVAYLTDTDQDVNTMTMGSVQIDQIEQERGASGLTDFTQDKPLLPAVYTGSSIEWAASADWAVANDEAWKTVALGADKNMFVLLSLLKARQSMEQISTLFIMQRKV